MDGAKGERGLSAYGGNYPKGQKGEPGFIGPEGLRGMAGTPGAVGPPGYKGDSGIKVSDLFLV